MLWKLGEIAGTLRTELTRPASSEARPRAVSIDTRTIHPGDLFLAIEGERLDGHVFVAAAFRQGAVAAIVRNGATVEGPVLLRVPDTLGALWTLAARARAETPARVIAVTGSSGKTTTRDMLATALGDTGSVLRPIGNRNNHIGLPLTLLDLEPTHRWAVLEMGMNHPGEIAALSSLARPHAAIITNVGRAHVGPVGGIDAVRRAKLEIVKGLEEGAPLLVPASDERLVQAARAATSRVETFGVEAHADHRIETLAPGPEAGYFVRMAFGPELVLRSPGRAPALAAAASLAMARILGEDVEACARRLGAWRAVPGRLAARHGRGVTVLDDSYNANPESMAMALETLREMPCRGRRIAVLGDMLELGEESRSAHRELAEELHGLWAVFLMGEETRETAALAQELLSDVRTEHFDDVETLIGALRAQLREGDVVLVKASHGMRLDRVADALASGEDRHAL